MLEPVPCIACGNRLQSVWRDSLMPNQPYGGTLFQARGHYGSTVFDPMDGSYLEINVCDPCLSKHSRTGRVLRGNPETRNLTIWKCPERSIG